MQTQTNDVIAEWIKTHGNVSVADVLKRFKLFYTADMSLWAEPKAVRVQTSQHSPIDYKTCRLRGGKARPRGGSFLAMLPRDGFCKG